MTEFSTFASVPRKLIPKIIGHQPVPGATTASFRFCLSRAELRSYALGQFTPRARMVSRASRFQQVDRLYFTYQRSATLLFMSLTTGSLAGNGVSHEVTVTHMF